jgi:hypothetical protein
MKAMRAYAVRPVEPPPEDVHRAPSQDPQRPATGRTTNRGRKVERPRDGGQPAGPSGQHDRVKDRAHTNS